MLRFQLLHMGRKISAREGNKMYGAILGDIIGSPYAFDQGIPLTR